MSNEISLAIYDLSKGTAKQLSAQILGSENFIEIIPHTSIVAFGREYYFAQSVGIQSVNPNIFRQTHDIEPVEIKLIGSSNVSQSEFELWCKKVIDDGTYSPQTYDLLFHNCNNFTNDAAIECFHFTHPVPEWIMNVPHRFLSTPLGQMTRPILEKMQFTASFNSDEQLEDDESAKFQNLMGACDIYSKISIDGLDEVDKKEPLNKKLRMKEPLIDNKPSYVCSNHNCPQIAILDFGSQYSHLIARRVREMNVFCQLYSCHVTEEELGKHSLIAVILSGGPHSVYEKESPHISVKLWEMWEESGIPILGICYGMQELAHVFGGVVAPGIKREYGKAQVKMTKECQSELFHGLPDEFVMWMSHGDKLHKLPDGFHKIASTLNSDYVVIENKERKLWGLQFHPEVTHSPLGCAILKNFVLKIAGAKQEWKMTNFASTFIENVRKIVGDGHVIGAVSGGVDSTVAAVLMNKAIGKRFHAIVVDNGCLRKDEVKHVIKRLRDDCAVDLRCIDASDKFIRLLKGITDPEKKRKIIGETFVDVFEQEASRITDTNGICEFLLQGTLYPDVIESKSYKGPSATIKTHHNVGGLPDSMKLKVIEPLRELFKDEVRQLGIALGLDEESVWRHPFPGPGLAIRILGEVTSEACSTLREADAIMIEELYKSGHYKLIGQAFVVFMPVKSVGVMGDGRTYENVACVRCVDTTDYMTADFYQLPYDVMGDISRRIINEVQGINRVCYDISSKPPATIEWE